MIKMPILKFPVGVALIEDDFDFAELVTKSIETETLLKVTNFYPKLDFSSHFMNYRLDGIETASKRC